MLNFSEATIFFSNSAARFSGGSAARLTTDKTTNDRKIQTQNGDAIGLLAEL
jgi:hypothetical protein